MVMVVPSGVSGVRTALSPNAGLKHTLIKIKSPIFFRQNSAKPERGIETLLDQAKRCGGIVRTALSPNAGLKLLERIESEYCIQGQNSAKPERGIETQQRYGHLFELTKSEQR